MLLKTTKAIQKIGKPRAIACGVWLFTAFFIVHPATAQRQVLKKLDEHSYAGITTKRGYHLDVRVDKAADLPAVLRVYTGHTGKGTFSSRKYKIVKASATRAFIPFSKLAPGFKKSYVRALWPKDQLKNGTWHHQITYSGHETLWSVAELFTGSGSNYPAIKKASGRKSDKVGKGSRLKIPEKLLIPILRSREAEFEKPDEPVYAIGTELVEETTIAEEDVTPVVSAPGDPDTSVTTTAEEYTSRDQSGSEDTSKSSTPDENSAEPEETLPAPAESTPIASGSSGDRKPEPVTNVEQRTGQGSGGAPKPAVNNTPAAKQQNPVSYEALVANQQSRGELRYKSTKEGRYAIYKLKAGEAIYSSVVVRFCGLIKADEVNKLAAEIIKYNNIKDETDLPIGFSVRIPYDLLEAEYKAADDPEYIAWLDNQQELARVSTTLEARNLEGVYLILDAGHGGRDPGAKFGGVWEDDYVYDIVCRIKKRLENETVATVYTTVLDPSVNYKVQNVKRFSSDQDEVLLTKPRYKLNSQRATTDGVNLRWHMTNHIYSNLMKRGVRPENVVFASLHADSLHASLQGSMVYIPDARKYPKNVKPKTRFKRYREYKGNTFRNTPAKMVEAQARSMNLARNFISASRKAGLPIHKQKPIRTVIVRNARSTFVPAVIKYNRVPTRCLIEVCNLNNRKDRAKLKEPKYRQKVADAFVAALFQTYGEKRTAVLSSGTRASRTGK